jgi:hypothetical protein
VDVHPHRDAGDDDVRVGVDDLPVGKHQDRKQHDDRDRDRQHQMQRLGPCYGENRE